MTHKEYESKSQAKRVEILKAGEKTMTHDELLAEINERIEELHDAEVCDGFIHALRAVVELHKQPETINGTRRFIANDCAACSHGNPCPTIQAIEKELK